MPDRFGRQVCLGRAACSSGCGGCNEQGGTHVMLCYVHHLRNIMVVVERNDDNIYFNYGGVRCILFYCYFLLILLLVCYYYYWK